MSTQKSPSKKQITETLFFADQISKTKEGSWVMRRGFFYRHGETSEKFADRVKEAFPQATVIDHGEVLKSFRGGASVKSSSHFWVEFKF